MVRPLFSKGERDFLGVVGCCKRHVSKGLLVLLLGAFVWLALPLVVEASADAPKPVSIAGSQGAPKGVDQVSATVKPVLYSTAGAALAVSAVSLSESITAPVVSCLGNSLTHGYPYTGTKTYPGRLQEMLDAAYGPGGFEVVNHGVNGYRADQVLAGLQSLGWLAEEPDFVLLLISRTVGEVQDIVDVVTAHTNGDGAHPQILVSAVIPTLSVTQSQAISLYNSRLEGNLVGLDLWFTSNWDDFYNPITGTAGVALMYDNYHPNEIGYLAMAENWFEAIETLAVRAAFVVSPAVGLAPLLTVFTNTSTGGYATSVWDFGDGMTSTLDSPTHTYTVGGIYTVTLTVSGTTAVDTLTRTHLITAYTPARAGFAAWPTAGVAPLTVVFTNTSTGDYSASAWDFGDGMTSTLDSPTHTYTAGGVYTVALAIDGLGGVDSLTHARFITAYTPVQAGFTAWPTAGVAPLTVVFTNTSTGDYSASAWDFGDGMTSTLDSPTHIYTIGGVYTVTLMVSGPGMSAVLAKVRHITVRESYDTYLPIVTRNR
jgi:PKD repeat protein